MPPQGGTPTRRVAATPDDRARPRRPPPRRRRADTMVAEGRDVWWHDIVDRQSDDCPPVAGRQRAHALPALHVGDDGQAEGHHAHDRPATSLGTSLHPRDDLRHQARRRVLVRGRHRLGDRPQLHRLRPAGQRARPGCCTRARRTRPAWDRWWQIIEDYKVSILYCAPTAIRAFMKQGEALAGQATTCRRCACSARSASRSTPRPGSGTSEHIGGGTRADRRHLVADRDRPDPDHAAARRHDDQAGLGDVPVPGHRGRRRRRRRQVGARSAAAATSSSSGRGRRCCAASTATRSATRQTYWSRFPGMYFAGDGAKRDDGRLLLAARPRRRRDERRRPPDLDDRGRDRRSSTTRRSPRRRSSARTDPITGQAIFAFVILKAGHRADRRARRPSCASTSPTSIGPIARPKFLMFTPDLPKTRSGKIMRRLLRDIAEGRALGDTTTLADAAVVETIRENTGAAEE